MSRVLIESFPHRPGGHCGSTAMRDIMKFYGHDLTEEMVFGLGSGINFLYYRNPGMKPPIYIGGRVFNLEESLCQNLGLKLEVVSGLKDDEAWNAVKKKIDDGTPVMVHADVYYLDYLNAKRHFAQHRIVLVGYDEEEGVAFVADNDRDTVQKCSLENLAKARSSACLPAPADNAYCNIEVPAAIKPIDEAIVEAIEIAVTGNIKTPPGHSIFDYAEGRVEMGTNGLGSFADSVSSWREEMDAETLNNLGRQLYVSIEKGGTGYGGFFRRIYGRFLKEASQVLGNSPLLETGGKFEEAGDRWSDTAMAFRDFAGRGPDDPGKSKVLESTGQMLKDIYSRELEAFEALDSIIASIKSER